MITEARIGEYFVAVQIHAVVQAAYAFEAESIGCPDFPPLRESRDELQRSSDVFLVYQRVGIIVAALSFDRDGDTVEITRLVVSPSHHRQGIATALLNEFEQRFPSGVRLIVSTAQANTAAVGLYRGLGYEEAGIATSPEGIALIRFIKYKNRTAPPK